MHGIVCITGTVSFAAVLVDCPEVVLYFTFPPPQVTGELGPLVHGVYGVGYSKVAQSSVVAAGNKLYVCGTSDRSKTFITQEP